MNDFILMQKKFENNFNVSFVEWGKRFRSLALAPTLNKINYFISIPFCRHSCSFCDLPKEGNHPTETYVDNLISQIQFVSQYFQWDKESYFWFGAGTSTMLSDKQFARIAQVINPSKICIESDIATYKKVFKWKQYADIKNLSIGIQTFDASIREQYRIQFSSKKNAYTDVEEMINLCRINNIRLNMDFICFNKDFEKTQNEVFPFLTRKDIDLSIYPYVSFFTSPDYEMRIKTEPIAMLIDEFMKCEGYSKLSANGYYTLVPDQDMKAYFSSDYIIGMGKYGRIVPKTKTWTCDGI